MNNVTMNNNCQGTILVWNLYVAVNYVLDQNGTLAHVGTSPYCTSDPPCNILCENHSFGMSGVLFLKSQ